MMSQLLISEEAISKSGRVLYAFGQFYFPFYGLRARQIFWQFNPYALISILIYELDEEVESGAGSEASRSRIQILRDYVSRHVLLDKKILLLFEEAKSYYDFEIATSKGGSEYSLDGLRRAMSWRSFDFRLMHRTLAQLNGSPYREEIFSWFRSFEIMMEIEDDLSSVEDDLAANSFNVFCLAARRPGGLDFVRQLYQDTEKHLVSAGESLSARDWLTAKNTLDAYREIVPKPELAELAKKMKV